MDKYLNQFLPIRQLAVKVQQLQAPDALLLVGYCPRCEEESETLGLSGNFEALNSLEQLESFLVASGEAQSMAICQHCEEPIPPEHLRFLGWFHFLPEVQTDFVLGLRFKKGRIKQRRYFKAVLGAALEEIEQPVSEASFYRQFGTYFTVRQLWKEFITQHPAPSRLEKIQVQEGYYLALLPAGDEVPEGAIEEVKAFAQGLAQEGVDFFQSLADLAEQDFPFEGLSYHEWLPQYADAIDAGELIAYVFVNTAQFMDVLGGECERRGLACNVVEGNLRRCRLAVEDYYLEMDWLNVLLKTVHTGLNFHQGIRAYALEEIKLMEHLVRLGRKTREMLPGIESSVREGHILEIHLGDKEGVDAELNLLSLASKVDADDPEQIEEFLRMLTGIDPQTGAPAEPCVPPEQCHCGRPAYLGLRIRPRSFFEPRGELIDDLYAIEVGDNLICYTFECEKHVAYARREQLPSSLEELKARRLADLDKNSFAADFFCQVPVEEVPTYLFLGYDVSAIMLAPGFVKTLLREAKIRYDAPEIHAYSPFNNVLVLSPEPFEEERRERLRRASAEIGSHLRYGAGFPLEYENRLDLTGPAKGQITVQLFE